MGFKEQKELHYSGKRIKTVAEFDKIFGSGKHGIVRVPSTVSYPTEVDGDEVVIECDGLYIAPDATFTVSNRCKGLIIKCRGDVVIEGTLSMSIRGALGTGTPFKINPTMPNGAMTLRRLTSYIPQYFAYEVSGTGSAGGNATTASSQPGAAGNWNFPGGGAGGRSNCNKRAGGRGGSGGSFGGGAGGGGTGGNAFEDEMTPPAPYPATENAGAGGRGGTGAAAPSGSSFGNGAGGGGAGNPGAATGGNTGDGSKTGGQSGVSGVGGLLMIMAAGNITIASTGAIRAEGGKGGNGYSVGTGPSERAGGSGGGGSGGGVIVILHGGTFTNNGTVSANAGVGGSPGTPDTPRAGQGGGAGFTYVGQVAL